MLEISHSEMATWTQCKRKWYLSYYLWFAPDPARENPVGTSHLGTRIHLSLEAFYGHGIDPLRVLDWTYDQEMAERPEFEPELTKERDLAKIMTEGYLQWISDEGIDAGIKLIATEHEERHQIDLPSGESFILRGRLDQLVERETDGARLFRDFKTVGSLMQEDELTRGTQMRTYALLAAMTNKETGQRADGGLYTMLRRCKRTATATPPFYAQVEVKFNRQDTTSTYLRVQAIAQEILDARAKLDSGADHRSAVYPTPGTHCAWACPFRLQCSMMDDGSRWQDALSSHFIRADPYSRYSSDKISQVVSALS